MKSKWFNQDFAIRHPEETTPVPVVSDAVIATVGVADGRMIPVLILDTSNRPDIEDMVKAHHLLGSQGDVSSVWGRPDTFWDRGILSLILTFLKPSRCLIHLQFRVEESVGLVDQIVRSQGLYIQAGRPGDRIRTTLDQLRVLIEVPSRDFQPRWDLMAQKAIFKRFRKSGMSRRNAKLAAERFFSEWRRLFLRRFNGPSDIVDVSDESVYESTE